MLFKEIIDVCSENHTKPMNKKCSITDCQSRWFKYLTLSLKGLKKLKKAIMREERIFVTGHYGQHTTFFLAQNSHFSIMKLGFV
jgi:hypothetical protein